MLSASLNKIMISFLAKLLMIGQFLGVELSAFDSYFLPLTSLDYILVLKITFSIFETGKNLIIKSCFKSHRERDITPC